MASIQKAESELISGLSFVALVILVIVAYLAWKVMHGFDLSDFWSRIIGWLRDHLNSAAGKGWNIVHALESAKTEEGTAIGDLSSEHGGPLSSDLESPLPAPSTISGYDIETGQNMNQDDLGETGGQG